MNIYISYINIFQDVILNKVMQLLARLLLMIGENALGQACLVLRMAPSNVNSFFIGKGVERIYRSTLYLYIERLYRSFYTSFNRTF